MSALWMPSIWISKPCASWPVLLRTSKFASDPTIATDCARAAMGASRVVSARPSAAAKRARERMTCTGLSLLRASGAARRGRRASAMPDRTRAVSWISAMRRSGKQWRSRETSRDRHCFPLLLIAEIHDTARVRSGIALALLPRRAAPLARRRDRPVHVIRSRARFAAALRLPLTTLLAPVAARAQSVAIVGSLANFDVLNNTGQDAHGFEIQIEGIQSADIYRIFGYWPVYGGNVIRY